MENNFKADFEDEVFFNIRRQRDFFAKIAMGCTAIAALSLVGIVSLLPLKEAMPFVVMVDKTTGEAEKLVRVRPASLEQQDAVLQAELVSYVVDRETYDTSDNPIRIPDVMARSSETAAEGLAQIWRSDAPQYPPTVYGDQVRIRVVVKSISLSPSTRKGGLDVARVRLTKVREEKGRQVAERTYVATIGYRFRPKENAMLSAVWKNPLGFDVAAYRIDAERAE